MKKFNTLFIGILLALLFFFLDSNFAQQASLWDQVPEEIKVKNSYKRIEWFYRQRAVPFDTIPRQVYLAELEKEIAESKKQKDNLLFDLQWSPIGPSGIISGFPSHWGEMSGRIRGLAVHPIDPNTVYIGAASGGIWKTINGGINWINIGDNLASSTYGAIAIDPNNPNTVYAGAGEIMYNFSTYNYDGQGLFKSTDGGNVWNQVTAGFGNVTHFGDIEVSPHNSNYVFAALGSGYYYRGNLSNEGIWRSTDGGLNWTRTLNVIDAFDVIVHPTISNIVYAATGGGVTNAGFYISTNSGTSWTQSNTGLPSSTSILRVQISICNTSPAIIYALIYNNSGSPVVYKSTNAGANWNQIAPGTQLGGNYGSGWSDQGWYDLCIAVNPTNPNQVFVGNIELHQSTNGTTFAPKRIVGGLTAWDCPTHVDLHRIVFAPSNDNIVYIACDGGIYKSTDGGSNWASANNGIASIQFYRIASHPANHDTLIGGAQDNGNFRTLNGGATAWGYTSTGDGMECFFDHSNPNTIYLSTQNGYLGKSTDLGVNISWYGTVNGNWIAPYFMHPTNNQWIYTANNSVLRSTDAGMTFSTIASNVSSTDFINTMAQSRVTISNMIFAGSGSYTSNPIVQVSTDGGFTWSNVTSNIPGVQRYISRVVFHPTDAYTVFIVRSGFSPGNKIYRSTNLGSSWSNVSGNLPDIPHNDFFIDPLHTSHYYAANDFGVYRSTNSGTTWSREGQGFPFVPAMDFDFALVNGKRYLRVGTHGRSAFETDLDNIIPVELTSFEAFANNGNVDLKWATATELNNSGFEIQRSVNDGNFYAIAFVRGFGTTTEPNEYSYTDNNAIGFLKYRLKQIDFDGTFEFSNVVEINSIKNLAFVLNQNYPNPFNPITSITYLLPSESKVNLTVVNSIGEKVDVIVNETQPAGKYDFIWNAENHSSGVYFYTIEVIPLDGNPPLRKSRKMILIR